MPTQNTGATVCPLPATYQRWAKLLNENGMLYLYAMTGYGKTVQALRFAQEKYKESLLLSAADENFFEALQQAPAGGRTLRAKTLLILDDLQWVFDEEHRQKLFERLLELRGIRGLHLLLLSRADLPDYLKPLQITRQLAVENQEALRLDAELTAQLVQSYPTLAALPPQRQEKIIQACNEVALGYPLGVNALCQQFERHPDDPKTAVALAVQDVYDYLRVHLFAEWTPSRRDAAVRLSVFESFDLEMAQQLLGTQADAVLNDFMSVGSFLDFKAPDSYTFVPFFGAFLAAQLAARPREEWQPLYEAAALCYESRRNYAQALRCWRKIGRSDKIAEGVIYLSENAEGCTFARTAQEYIGELSAEWEQRDPRILGAKVMLAGYRMQTEECVAEMARLKKMAEAERKCVMRSGALDAYVRTAIACPYDTADKLKDNMLLYLEYVRRSGIHLKNIMPTGNMPSLINGGLDLLQWEKNKKLLYPIIKPAVELLMGKQAIGIADAAMGEILYEQNKKTQAMAYLTKSLSTANYNGSIRVQYAATAIMARLFQSEGQGETAEDILRNVRQKAEQEYFGELLPNIDASLVYCALLRQDTIACEDWLKQLAPDEYAPFYITMRFQLLTKARVYTALGKTMEALYILNLLEEFATLYQRTYFHIEVLILKAIILYRRGEDWQPVLKEGIQLARPHALVRVFADQGSALLPLWRALEWPETDEEEQPPQISLIAREMKAMANFYPNYLKAPRRHGSLSPKEHEVLVLMADGCNNNQIADILAVNLGTVKFHVANIMKKLEAENRTAAVKTAQDEHLL